MLLYNHKNEIFLFTFHIEHTTHFLHCKTQCLQSLHTYWVFLDLWSCKSTKIFNFEDYIQCVLVIWVWWQFNQLSQTSTFCQDVKKYQRICFEISQAHAIVLTWDWRSWKVSSQNLSSSCVRLLQSSVLWWVRSSTCTSSEDTSQKDDIYDAFANDQFRVHWYSQLISNSWFWK